jgi:pimeloyl-ACP methyl ester carboxylesterase
VGLVIYPGGRVDPRSYAPLARTIAEAGYLVVIPPMPLDLAVLAPDRASDVMAAYPEIEQWVLGGHSLGGAMAAKYAHDNPSLVSGLVLWAAYPADSDSLKGLAIPVLSIYGTEDMGLDGIEAGRDLLPDETQWVVMEGGNHAQFGWYGDQRGDGEATISRIEQQERIADETLAFLEGLGR